MLNPEGVVFGNNRVTLSGQDVNRVLYDPEKEFHPEAYHFRRMVNDMIVN